MPSISYIGGIMWPRFFVTIILFANEAALFRPNGKNNPLKGGAKIADFNVYVGGFYKGPAPVSVCEDAVSAIVWI